MTYLPHSESDWAAMLAAVGAGTVEDLFRDIPTSLRETATPNVPGPLGEADLLRHMAQLARRNRSLEDLVCFAGGGIYDRFIPSIVLDVISRPEFKTGYTPYQPEASQGILQALFEYQSMVCELTAMPMANASLYDGASALGEAVLLAAGEKQCATAVVSRALSPAARHVTRTYCSAMGIEIVEVPFSADTGRTDLDALRAAMDGSACCVALQQPNYFGVLEDMATAAEIAHASGALFIASVEPISLGLLKPPGQYGADIAIGEGQPLGLPPAYGGPLLGIFACREEMMRRVPGRIVGETVDADGKTAYCLTLQAREQHIRREKATSNICTSESLCALAAAVHLAALGPQGLRDVAEQSVQKAHYLAARLQEAGARLRFGGPFLNEFALDVGDPGDEVVRRLADHGYLVGPALGREYPELASCVLVAVTEQRTREDLDGLVGRATRTLPPGAGAQTEAWAPLPGHYRETPPRLPEVSEPEIARHYAGLARDTFNIDRGFYPLGSCTMKYNPKVNERIAAMPGWALLHPDTPAEHAQGALRLIAELEQWLSELGGMDVASLQPPAGAAGEFCCVRMFRAYHESRGDGHRTRVIVPDSAHGTNPASVTRCAYTSTTIRSADGRVDLGELKKGLGDDVAGVMLTNPNTLGLFERDILQIVEMVHAAGALLYYDGANMNAIMGYARPGDMGFDAMHFNLHKTFSTPHGGGGPGSGPVAVKTHLAPFLPVPRVVERDGAYAWNWDYPQSIGRVHAYFGSFLVAVRAYAYLLTHGAEGLKRVSEAAVLNANYVAEGLKGILDLPYEGPFMHECVLSAQSLEHETGVRALDIAKRLLDYGMHPPTVYFPLIVKEAMMIEPTETESKATLDRFIEVVRAIAEEARTDPQLLHEAPHHASVKRVDEATAARHPKLRWARDGEGWNTKGAKPPKRHEERRRRV